MDTQIAAVEDIRSGKPVSVNDDAIRLVGGVEPRVETADDIDPFVKAREEALRLMEDPSS